MVSLWRRRNKADRIRIARERLRIANQRWDDLQKLKQELLRPHPVMIGIMTINEAENMERQCDELAETVGELVCASQ